MATSHREHFWLEISDLRFDEEQMETQILFAADPVIGQRRVCNDVLFVVSDNFDFSQVVVALISMTVLCCG